MGTCGCGGRQLVHAGTEVKEMGHEGRRMARGHVHIEGEGRHKDTKGREREDADMEVEERVRNMQVHVCVGREGKETCRE